MPVKGVYDREMRAVLKKHGFKIKTISYRWFPQPTLEEVASKLKKNQLYLISQTEHFCLYLNGKVVDNSNWGGHCSQSVRYHRAGGWKVDAVMELT